MLNDIIVQMKENRLSNNEEYNIKELLDTIKIHLNSNIDILEKSYKYEYKKNLNVKKLIESFDYIEDNKLGNIDTPFKNEYGKVSNNYVPYGVVGVVVNNDLNIYNLSKIISLLIQTNNSIIIEPYRSIGTLNILIELVNQILEQINGYNKIIINNKNDKLQDNNLLDLLIFIGKKAEFDNLESTCLKKYYGIGNYELIIDNVLDNNLIEEAKRQNIKIINKSNEIDFYENFNNESSNYCTAFMSESKTEIRKFISNVNSSYLLINAIPTLQDDINITIDDLMYKKSTLIYED